MTGVPALPGALRDEFVGRLRVTVWPDRASMGRAAGAAAADRLRGLLESKERARVIFAAAPSQGEMLDALAVEPGIDWTRVEAFHLDEYMGLTLGHPRSFGAWLDGHIWRKVQPGRVERIDGANPAGPKAEVARYAALLVDGGIDLALVGVGENGHVAFNEPHLADFEDPVAVRLVDMDEVTRRQQVRDGLFEALEDVPSTAMTVSMSTVRAFRSIVLVVPGPHKAPALRAMLGRPITTACPASVLRTHPDAVLFADVEALPASSRQSESSVGSTSERPVES